MTDLPVEIPPVEGEEPEEELAATPTDEERSLLDSLRKQREVLAETRETFISIPGYEDSGLELLARYRLVNGPELEKLDRKTETREKRRGRAGSRWATNLGGALDTMALACNGVFIQGEGDETPRPLTVGGEE